MPVDQETHALRSPWKEFLSELDDMLTEPVEIHCIGGFVLTLFYGLPRTTGDIDYYTAIPPNLDLDAMAGQGSALHGKHKVQGGGRSRASALWHRVRRLRMRVVHTGGK